MCPSAEGGVAISTRAEAVITAGANERAIRLNLTNLIVRGMGMGFERLAEA